MYFRTIATVFFITHQGNSPILAELVEKAGMTGVKVLNQAEQKALRLDNKEVVYGQWGAFKDAWAVVDSLPLHSCLQIYSSINKFLDLLIPEDSSNAPSFPPQLLTTFQSACSSLQPDIAYLDTQSHNQDEHWRNKQGSRDVVLGTAWMATESNPDELARQPYALLYVSSTMFNLFESDPAIYHHVTTGTNGYLLSPLGNQE